MADQETPESSAVPAAFPADTPERRAVAAAALHSLAFLGGPSHRTPLAELPVEPGVSGSGGAAEPAAGAGASAEPAPPQLPPEQCGGHARDDQPHSSDSDDTDIENDEVDAAPRWRDYYVFEHVVPAADGHAGGAAAAAAPAAEAAAVPAEPGAGGGGGGGVGDGDDSEDDEQQQRRQLGREQRGQRQPQFMPRGVIAEGPGSTQVPPGVTTLEAFQPRQSRPRLRFPPLPSWEDRLERTTLAELIARTHRTRDMAYCALEQLVGYQARPEDDLQQVILAHGKVILDPRHEYVIKKPLLLGTWCYVVGHGARIRVQVSSNHVGGIKCGYYRDVYPDSLLVQGVTRCVFVDCVFVDDPPQGEHKRPMIRAECACVFMDCLFYDCRSVAIMADVKGEVKGCNFYNCHTAVLYVGSLQFEVTDCAFQRCVIGVKSPNSPLKVSYCCARDCVCLVLMGGSGKIIGCSFMHGAELGGGSVVTCVGGTVQLLSAYHIVAKRRDSYPIFVRNHLNEGCMFVGHRRGCLYMRRCHLSAAQLMLDMGCSQKVNCQGSYVNSMSVLRMTTTGNEASAQRQCRCECGNGHTFIFPMVVEARDAVILPKHRSQPVETLEFCSDSDD